MQVYFSIAHLQYFLDHFEKLEFHFQCQFYAKGATLTNLIFEIVFFDEMNQGVTSRKSYERALHKRHDFEDTRRLNNVKTFFFNFETLFNFFSEHWIFQNCNVMITF